MSLHRPFAMIFIAAAVLFSFAAQAQQKPYEPVAVKYAGQSADDTALAGLMTTLQKAAEARDIAAIAGTLAKSFTALTCKPDPTLICAPGKKGVKQPPARLSPAERLAQGLCCAGTPRKDITKDMIADAVSGQIAALLDAGGMGSNSDVQGSVCRPALPDFDRPKAARIVKAAGIEPSNLRVASNPVPVRLKPDAKADVSETIAAGLVVPLVTDLDTLIPDGWNAIALPEGGLGYTDALGLNDLAPAALCFVREGTTWKTGFFVLREE